MADRGLFGTITDTMMSPLFMGGAGLLTGGGMSGMLQGMQAGTQYQDQQRQRQREDATREAVYRMPGALTMADRELLAANPQMATQVLGHSITSRIDPAEKLKLEQIRAAIAHSVSSESRSAQLFPTQLEAAKADLAVKQRELASPQGKLTELDQNKRLVYTDPRTGQTRVIMDAQASASGPFKDAKQKADVEEGLRKEFASLAKPYFETRDAWGRIQQSAKSPSAAGDVALIFNFMKMLDPGSVVREGEFATAQNAAGVPERVMALYNRILSGERLTDQIRADFLNQSRGLYDRAEAQYQGIQKQYHAITTRTGADPQNTIVDFGIPGGQPKQHQALPRSFDHPDQIPEGAKFRDEQTGVVYQKRNGQIAPVQ